MSWSTHPCLSSPTMTPAYHFDGKTTLVCVHTPQGPTYIPKVTQATLLLNELDPKNGKENIMDACNWEDEKWSQNSTRYNASRTSSTASVEMPESLSEICKKRRHTEMIDNGMPGSFQSLTKQHRTGMQPEMSSFEMSY